MEFKQGDRVRIEKNGTVYEGRVMPSAEGYITIKMKSGYNAGFSTDKVRITLLESNGESRKRRQKWRERVQSGN